MSAAGSSKRSRKNLKVKKNRIRSTDRQNNEGETSGGSRRHPAHLKGKEIGLFYARRGRENAAKRKQRPVSNS